MTAVAINRRTLTKTCRSFFASKEAACFRCEISSSLGCLHFPVGGVGAGGGAMDWLGVEGDAVMVAMLEGCRCVSWQLVETERRIEPMLSCPSCC